MVVKLRHISNFTDFQSLALQPGVRVRYAQTAREIENADLIVLPGTKNTIEDLIDLRNRGMDAAIARHIRQQKGVTGDEQKPVSFEEFREREFDRIADIVRASVDMDAIYRIAKGEV